MLMIVMLSGGMVVVTLGLRSTAFNSKVHEEEEWG